MIVQEDGKIKNFYESKDINCNIIYYENVVYINYILFEMTFQKLVYKSQNSLLLSDVIERFKDVVTTFSLLQFLFDA